MKKKIVAAWIEQVLEFGGKSEFLEYMEKLKTGRPQQFKVIKEEQLESGAYKVRIRKQYNNNAFPDVQRKVV